MSLNDQHFIILDLLMADAVVKGRGWVVMPMRASRDYADGTPGTRQWAIPGRRARLKELNNLGLVQVRTVTIAAWYSPLSDRPVDGYSGVEVQVMLTPQGRDVALSKRTDGHSMKG